MAPALELTLPLITEIGSRKLALGRYVRPPFSSVITLLAEGGLNVRHFRAGRERRTARIKLRWARYVVRVRGVREYYWYGCTSVEIENETWGKEKRENSI